MRKLKTTWNALFKMWILPSSWLNPVCRKERNIGRVFFLCWHKVKILFLKLTFFILLLWLQIRIMRQRILVWNDKSTQSKRSFLVRYYGSNKKLKKAHYTILSPVIYHFYLTHFGLLYFFICFLEELKSWNFLKFSDL